MKSRPDVVQKTLPVVGACCVPQTLAQPPVPLGHPLSDPSYPPATPIFHILERFGARGHFGLLWRVHARPCHQQGRVDPHVHADISSLANEFVCAVQPSQVRVRSKVRVPTRRVPKEKRVPLQQVHCLVPTMLVREAATLVHSPALVTSGPNKQFFLPCTAVGCAFYSPFLDFQTDDERMHRRMHTSQEII